ncbi:MAG: AAA family ATPase [Candidatus Brocadiales bacterium]|nr:AAA family ATPase [Candidatus Brocadiales bacterium]
MTKESKNLKHIKVSGFKSIAKLDLPMENINILIGANGVGKTNLISLFTFLSHLSRGKLRNYVETEGRAERFFHFGTRHTSEIMFDLRVGKNGYHVEFSPNLDDDSLVFCKEYCTITISNKQWNLYPKMGESGFVSGKKADSERVKKYTREYLEKCRVYHFHDTSNQALYKKTNKLVNYHYLEKDAANIAPFLYDLKNCEWGDSQSYQQIVSAIQSVAPFFHDFYLEPSGKADDEDIILRWMHKKHDTPFSANVLSDGTARFICLATLFLQPVSRRPDTIILDEPELGLHPAALNVLADIIRATAKETQVICSTQSVAFANLFEPEDFIVVDAEDGVSNFRRLEREPLEHWLEDYGMGDIWSKNLIGGRPAW